MAATMSQLSCFSAINRSFHHQRRSSSFTIVQCPLLRLPKMQPGMSLKGHGLDSTESRVKITTSYAAGASKSQAEGTANSYLAPEEPVQQRGAKIHDFCFGIPFGGLVLSGGLIGFIFSRNPANLSPLIFGGALLALSILSLKIWRQGKSSTPFILGQAVLTATLLWNNLKTYSLTKKVFPTGFYTVISAAMLCFYSYVMLSGGNPPPKKLKPSPSVSS